MTKPLAVAWLMVLVAFWSARAIQAQRGVDLNAEIRALQEDLVAQSNATLNAVRREMGAELEMTLRQRNAAIREFRKLRRQSSLGEKERLSLGVQLAAALRERDELMARLERENPIAREAIVSFRQSIAALLDNPSPEEREALSRYAEGDDSALDVAERIVQADAAALQKAAAVKLRGIAQVMLDAKERGTRPIERAIAAWELASRADAADSWTWITLTRLYLEAGRVDSARQAGEKAVSVATSDRHRAVGLTEAGAVLAATGDLQGARRRFEESLDVFRRLEQTDAADLSAQRDVRVTQSRVGNLFIEAGKLAEARTIMIGLMKTLEPMAVANPKNEVILDDFSVVLHSLANVAEAEGVLQEAEAYARSDLRIAQQIANIRPTVAKRRNVAASFYTLASILDDAGNPQGARAGFQSGVQISVSLLRADNGNQSVRSDFDKGIVRLERVLERLDDVAGLHQLGDALVLIGDFPKAGARAEKTLTLALDMATAAPMNLERERMVSISYAKLAEVLASEKRFDAARGQFEESLRIARRIAPIYPARSTLAQQTLRQVLLGLGAVLRELGDIDGARKHFEESLDIGLQLAARDSSAPRQRDLLINHVRLAELPGGDSRWAAALKLAEDLNGRGQLSAEELEELRQRAKNARQ